MKFTQFKLLVDMMFTPDENGGMLCGYVYAKTELGSGFTVEAYNCWTKEVYCRIELNAEA